MKTEEEIENIHVCMYTSQIEIPGGIESVIRRLLPILSSHGIDCWVACEAGKAVGVSCENFELFPASREDRRRFWEAVLKKRPTDVVIYHHTTSSHVNEEIGFLRAKGIKCVSMIHAPFPSIFLLKNAESDIDFVMARARLCDMVITVSRMDATFWTTLGINATHVQNPFIPPQKKAEKILHGTKCNVVNLLWVGRFCDQKQPECALDAFSKINHACPNTRLIMVGGDKKGIAVLAKRAQRLGIKKYVDFVPPTQNVGEFFETADIHLMTSSCESFCLVWAEAKSVGIPTVMFDLPYLELAEDKTAFVAVPQGDCKALADAAIDLIKNDTKRLLMGKRARESIAPFNDDSVWESWEHAFSCLMGKCVRQSFSPEVQHVVNQCMMGWTSYCKRNVWAVRMTENWQLLTHTSLRGFARVLENLIKTIRRIVR